MITRLKQAYWRSNFSVPHPHDFHFRKKYRVYNSKNSAGQTPGTRISFLSHLNPIASFFNFLNKTEGSVISFISGARSMLPITTGVIPFGLVMGTVASHAELSWVQTAGMNFFVFAGASQLAAVDLMVRDVPSLIVILTGLMINLRFLLYSAALSPLFEESCTTTRALASYCVTDQSYACLMANTDDSTPRVSKILFYFGNSLVMILAWQSSVAIGFVFGNLAPQSLSLEFAVPLSFVALVMPTLKDRSYYWVAILSAVLSIALKSLPFNLGLLVSALTSIAFGAYLLNRRSKK